MLSYCVIISNHMLWCSLWELWIFNIPSDPDAWT